MGTEKMASKRGGEKGSSPSLNLYAIVIDENQRGDGTGAEKRGVVVGFFQSSHHGKRQGIGKE